MTNSIEHLRIEAADNGIIISYTECCKVPGKKGDVFGNTTYNDRKEVFDFDEDEMEGEKFEEGFERFKELFKRSMYDKSAKDAMMKGTMGKMEM